MTLRDTTFSRYSPLVIKVVTYYRGMKFKTFLNVNTTRKFVSERSK